MNIVLNAVAYNPGGMGGVESYFRTLVQALQSVDNANAYELLCNERHAASLPCESPRFRILGCPYAKPSLLWYLRAAIRQVTPLDILQPFVNRLTADVIHHPFSILQPLNHAIPSVLTFHDMQHEFFPEYFSKYALQARRKLWRPSAEKATRIVAISEYARRCLVDRYEIAPDKIDVVHTGLHPQFRTAADPQTLESARRRLGLSQPFIYYPAATWPHKNHLRLLQAIGLLRDRGRFEGQLVLSGMDMQSHGPLLQEIGRLGLRDDVVLLGYLPAAELPGLYAMARLMAFPSLFEGFGIPLLEAMACGCPIACSNTTSIPEVVADAALTFDPWSVEAMAGTIGRLWDDDALCLELQARGRERVRLFSSEEMARQTIQSYEKARQ